MHLMSFMIKQVPMAVSSLRVIDNLNLEGQVSQASSYLKIFPTYESKFACRSSQNKSILLLSFRCWVPFGISEFLNITECLYCYFSPSAKSNASKPHAVLQPRYPSMPGV
jgi:hypothetical protein